MSLAVFAYPIPSYAYGATLSRPFVLTRFGGQNEQRGSRSGRMFRSWGLSFEGLDEAERAGLDAFYVARSGQVDSFLWRNPDPRDSENWCRVGVALGASVALQVLFPLPTGASEYAGDYPLDDVRTVLRDDGVAITRTVQTDNRTLTAGAAPAGSSVMTADYCFARRVRFDGPLVWAKGDHGLWSCAASLREVAA